MNEDKIFKTIEDRVKKLFDSESSGHDFYHLKRVFNLALKIQEGEGGDKIIIGVASLVHDIHRLMDSGSNKNVSPEESLPRVSELLTEDLLTKNQIDKILNCVKYHEVYNFADGKLDLDLETKILQDADRIDAIGAIGIGRCFTYCGHFNIPMWLPDIPLAEKYNFETKDPSALHHFFLKLLKLGDNMNTKTGQMIAKARHHYIEDFVKQFMSEWAGEK